jgi:cation diffusion facilitator CzcD-associated flavoprotein CzcO
MRTNLSRFTVAFSDLDWESVIPGAEVPVFPHAEQVAAYLDSYAERYIPVEVLRLGCRVVETVRRVEGGVKWGVRWVRERERYVDVTMLLYLCCFFFYFFGLRLYSVCRRHSQWMVQSMKRFQRISI